MSEVRLRFSGMVRFISSIVGVFTGLAFITLITRNLSAVEYGEWSVIGSLMIYGVTPALGLGYWYTRYTARNLPIARYGIFITSIFSLGGIIAFFVAATIFINEFENMFPILLVASLQVITSSLIHSLNSISNGKKPEISAYGMLIFETAKVAIAFIIIYGGGNFSLIDVIYVLIISQIIQIVVLGILIRNEFRKKVELKNIKKILKSLWIPLYDRMSDIVFTSDILVVTLLTSSFAQVTIFKIAFVFSTMVEFGLSFTYPLYIKLLGGGKEVDITTSIKMVLLFTLPIVVGIIILAKPLLFLLNPDYIVSEQILQILTVYSLSLVCGIIFQNIILGSEKVDVIGKFGNKELIYSNLFKLPTIDLIFKSTYLISITILTITVWNNEMPFEEFGRIWAFVLLVTNIPFTIYKLILAKKIISFSFPWNSISKYVISSILMGIIVIFLMSYLDYTNSEVTSFAPQIIRLIGIAAGFYFALMLIIDKETRELFKAALLAIKKI
jgi:O-antigen/teichoic acid export membrane protein